MMSLMRVGGRWGVLLQVRPRTYGLDPISFFLGVTPYNPMGPEIPLWVSCGLRVTQPKLLEEFVPRQLPFPLLFIVCLFQL